MPVFLVCCNFHQLIILIIVHLNCDCQMKRTKENDTLLIKFKRSICFFWHLKKMNISFDKVTMLNNRYTKDKKKILMYHFWFMRWRWYKFWSMSKRSTPQMEELNNVGLRYLKVFFLFLNIFYIYVKVQCMQSGMLIAQPCYPAIKQFLSLNFFQLHHYESLYHLFSNLFFRL